MWWNVRLYWWRIWISMDQKCTEGQNSWKGFGFGFSWISSVSGHFWIYEKCLHRIFSAWDKVIGFCSDGASNMQGKKTKVNQHLWPNDDIWQMFDTSIVSYTNAHCLASSLTYDIFCQLNSAVNARYCLFQHNYDNNFVQLQVAPN